MSAVSVMTPHGERKLGRLAPVARPQCLRLGAYLTGLRAVPLPDSVDYRPKASEALSHMYANDRLGCCVISGKGHNVGVWSGNETGTPIIATDTEIINAYHTICGPGDRGCNIASVLDYMKSKGMILGGQARKIDGYVAIDNSKIDEVKTAIIIFGAITLGVNLPNAWASSSEGGLWDVTTTRIVGGHDISGVGYDKTGVIISTWGGFRTITWAAFQSSKWVDECYAILSPDWYSVANKSPSNLDVDALKADLQKIGGGDLPDIGPDPNPPEPPPLPPDFPPDPVPTPTPTPPAPVGSSLDQVTGWIGQGISNGGPYGMFAAAKVQKVQQAAIDGVTNNWPRAGR